MPAWPRSFQIVNDKRHLSKIAHMTNDAIKFEPASARPLPAHRFMQVHVMPSKSKTVLDLNLPIRGL